ncbi:hypothetical protein HOK51_04390 [Candidatus Woesearchaeota archaeon]|jgi:nicotinate phosphoribosyltransferase|nr:hypothetical protein [Candidatus Woesearchaeota archaeon]MBT6519062.1 hypothetical protein [Candidatus Woesearchaeota archaeon]MBT7366874.1 hypothetical protein [Candidatus Woesearchaeota archaeon]
MIEEKKLRQPNLLGMNKKVLAGLKDYYETTMADSFIWMNDSGRQSTFNLAVRGLRDHKVVSQHTFEKDGKKFETFEIEKHNYLMSCGQEQAIAYILNYELGDNLIDMYERKGLACKTIEHLKENRTLNIDVYGIEEGVPIFGHEPILSVNGGFEEDQFPETLMLSPIGYQTAVATTASYIRNILKEFGREDIVTLEGGSRRCISPLHASKAALVGGMKGTSLEQMGVEYPELEDRVGGSAGHSAVLHAGGDEKAFEKQLRAYFKLDNDDSVETIEQKINEIEKKGSVGPTFLLDTYDSTEGLEVAINIAKKYDLKKWNVRTDSGDPLERTKYMRSRLDERGCEHAKIMASDDLTADKIYYLLENNAPIDIILIGTYLVNPFKLPGPVYKVARDEQENGNVIDICKIVKNNPSKATLPGRLEVYRVLSTEDGMANHDLILMAGEKAEDYLTEGEEAVKLTKQFVKDGELVHDFGKLTDTQDRREFWLNKMRPQYMKFKGADEYPVKVSPLVEKAKTEYAKRMFG